MTLIFSGAVYNIARIYHDAKLNTSMNIPAPTSPSTLASVALQNGLAPAQLSAAWTHSVPIDTEGASAEPGAGSAAVGSMDS